MSKKSIVTTTISIHPQQSDPAILAILLFHAHSRFLECRPGEEEVGGIKEEEEGLIRILNNFQKGAIIVDRLATFPGNAIGQVETLEEILEGIFRGFRGQSKSSCRLVNPHRGPKPGF